jgi:hypothetical protein
MDKVLNICLQESISVTILIINLKEKEFLSGKMDKYIKEISQLA